MEKVSFTARHLRLMFNLSPAELVRTVNRILVEDKDYYHSYGSIYYVKSAIKKFSIYYNMQPIEIKFDDEVKKKKYPKKKKEINPLIKELIESKKRENKIKTLKSLLQTPVTYRGFGRSNKNT